MMALKFGRKKSMGPGDPAIKIGTSRKIRGSIAYATGKLPQRPSHQPPRDYTLAKNWMFSSTKPKAKPIPKVKPAPKKTIKYKKEGKVIGDSGVPKGQGKKHALKKGWRIR